MHRNIKLLSKKILEVLDEVETYEAIKENLNLVLDRLFKDYQNRRLTSAEYKQKTDHLLKGKDKQYWNQYYDSIIFALLKKIEYINSQIFYFAYNDKTADSLGLQDAPSVVEEVKAELKDLIAPQRPGLSDAEITQDIRAAKSANEALEQSAQEQPETRRLNEIPVRPAGEAALRPGQKAPLTQMAAEAKVVPGSSKPSQPQSPVGQMRDAFLLKEDASRGKPSAQSPPLTVRQKAVLEPAAHPTEQVIVQKPMHVHPAEVQRERPAQYATGPVEPQATLQRPKLVVRRPEPIQKKEPLFVLQDRPKPDQSANVPKPAPKPVVAPHLSASPMPGSAQATDRGVVRNLPKESLMSQVKAMMGKKNASPIAEESEVRMARAGLTKKELERTMHKHEREFKMVPKPMRLGRITSPVSRSISSYIIKRYPQFFRNIYTSLRQANISILSHTYINVMVFFSLIVALIMLPLTAVFFYFLGNSLLLLILKAIGISLLLGITTFVMFYYYPQTQASRRGESIKANLPFAINHISAIASAGIGPGRMFHLVASSRDYGEVASEFEKIVEYVDIFGYDIITASKTTANTTPSKEFKEFLDGFVSTIESGGDLNIYLKQKADEEMLSYELERKRYTELVATLSDIYTGLMLAAPMFLIVTLSLIGVLGGTIFGMRVETILLLGTYVLIPMINFVFMAFLQITQPSI